jgi:hypothetical protein
MMRAAGKTPGAGTREMVGRAVVPALLLFASIAAMPATVAAQEPSDSAIHAGPDCAPEATDCVAGAEPAERVIPSRPSELVDGHEDQSIPILVGLSAVAFTGLVVSILHRLALEEG